MIRIDAPYDRDHYAILDDTPSGVRVAFYRLTGRGDGPAGCAPPLVRRLCVATFDIPWHVACDRVHDLLRERRP